MSKSTEVWPTELRVKPNGTHLVITFENDELFEFPAEFLRVESPSAEVKGHGKGQEVTVPGKRNVRITNLEPVGNYAIRIIFDDGHSTGLYSWPLLLELGREQGELWLTYLDKLEAEGLSRD
ncbi:MAG: DUF971 domain-containing protein [Rhizobiales bacterium]|nr:DUF971 domain-containing protein [Hyphomicrobiales bacterium]